ncbi:MAG: imidazole glycerol phosphate synthase subunit HisH [Candidatus Marinimicrobia bacterium]|jgi:imidazole glycerol-phosphate synthase subunit HisH|nr:imidazole glycerol phosphate synthase subunit HisH [Candidatus Neomarinimicrobiota bacterium]
MNTSVSIIDYGIGNIYNVQRAFEKCGVEAQLIDSVEQVQSSSHLILPGVGAFAKGMYELNKRGFVDSIISHADQNKPLLGICLGMQMLLDDSNEFVKTKGLGIIPGHVEGIPNSNIDGSSHKIPHIGWNELKPLGGKSNWKKTILEGINPGEQAYFVHSFTAFPADEKYRLADADYNGRQISAVIRKGNTYGCQFHPEKSGLMGLTILKSFLDF